MSELTFTAFGTPRPQGSARAFVRGNRAYITSDNPKLKPYRHTLTQVAMQVLAQRLETFGDAPMFPRNIPVEVHIVWTLAKPKSKAKYVKEHTTKPDADKLARAVLDSLTGVAFEDDAQVVYLVCRKMYGAPERTEVTVRALEG